MAKIFLYAVARQSDAAALERAKSLINTSHSIDGVHPMLSLMVPLADDPFGYVPGVSFERPSFVIEIAQPMGKPLEPAITLLQPQLTSLLELLDRNKTQVLAGYHRAFKVTGKNQLIYHYLMQKKAGFRSVDYIDYYANNHYQFGIATPGIDYYQTYKDAEFTHELAQRWGVVAATAENVSEMHMNDVNELLHGDGIAEVSRGALADEELFVDRPNSRMFTMQLIARRTL